MDISQLVSSIDASIANLGQATHSGADHEKLLAASKRLQEAPESLLDAVSSIFLGVSKANLPPNWASRTNGHQRSIANQLSEQLLIWDSSLLSLVREREGSLHWS
jgi:hypothetical protein